MALVVKNLPANAGDIRDRSSIPRSGRSPGGEHGNLLQYSCLENPMDRGDWQAMVHRVKKHQTQLRGLSTHTEVSIDSIILYWATIMCKLCLQFRAVSPTFLVLGICFTVDHFPCSGAAGGKVWGWFKHITVTVYFISCYYDISSTSDHQALDSGGWEAYKGRI